MTVSKWKHYSTWAIIILPILTIFLEQAKLLNLGDHGVWVIPLLSVAVGICKAIPQVAAAKEAAQDVD